MARNKKPFRLIKLFSIWLFLTSFLWAPSVFAASNIYFEFLNSQQNYQRQDTFPWGVSNEIVVASKEVDIRTLLPIKISIGIVGGKEYTNTIPNNPVQYCRSADGCSIPGAVVPDPGPSAKIIINATDKNGKVIVEQRFGFEKEPTKSDTKITQSASKETAKKLGMTDTQLLMLAVAAIFIIGGGVFLLTKQGDCQNECTLGDCRSCEISEILLATHGKAPGMEKDLADIGKHLLDLLGLAPLQAVGTGKALGGGLGGAVIKELLGQAIEVCKNEARGVVGVDIYVKLQVVECQNKTCWPWFWNSCTAWVTTYNLVQVFPPNDSFKHNQGHPKDVGWSFHYLFSFREEDRKNIGREIRKAALEKCPAKCSRAKKV